MVDGARGELWAHTAELLAKLHNVNCSKVEDMKTAADFNFHELAKKKAAPAQGRKLTFKEKIAAAKSRFLEG